ncbi:porin family protein [Arsenicitalea aurantiaca]|uniref:Porin family protein n=1 Tax=Arsenicitalea aurantiaca TaxID=1783274 RepID=A0A433XF03_9HYPH|nr:outer membrane protein [Arsenicitalea aurantiaca]RUT32697.1 porin family protein [Arsenicitalea aurantiaca]
MKIAQKFLVATAATALMTASAFAADLYIPVEQPFIPSVSAPLGWTGAYVGVHAGYGWGTVDWAEVAVTPETGEFDIDGWLAGVQAGYNVNLDGVVLGIEGDIAWADFSGTDEAAGGSIDIEGQVNWLATLRGRVGFAADAFLIYGTAGVAFAGTDADLTPGTSNASNTHTGWVVGAGVEAMVTDNISLKAEYLYHDFGSQTYDFDGSYAGLEADASFNVSTAKIGLNFHF